MGVISKTMTETTLGEYDKEDNDFNGINGDDVVDHTTKVLAILGLIKIPNVDPNQLRLNVSHSRLLMMHESGGLMRSFSDYMDDDPDYIDFVNWLNSKFRNYRRMDGKTKNALWDFWIKGGDEEVLMDDVVSSDDNWEESDITNHLNDESNIFFKPYFDAQEGNNISTFEKGSGCFDEHKPKIHGRNISKLDRIMVSDYKTEHLNDEV
nr:SGNH hydrolase-type esterase domain-containing protein [Tanacetum cinerariifolium]